MMNDEITPSWPVRIWHAFERLCSDIMYLFEPNKLFVYSWIKYRGARMLPNNWGDDINVYFFESISRMKVKDLSHSYFYKIFPVTGYSCIGSILGNFKARKYEVWGSGLIQENWQLQSIPCKIHSVRGPLTQKELLKKGIDCPEKYGDPALLISRYYRKVVDKKYTWGIIPHYSDENNAILIEFSKLHPEFLIISMCNYSDWHEIPDKIMSCHRIISSSLHGLIMADSYGIKNAWIKFSDDIQGGDFKYKDYLKSVGREIDSPYIINDKKDIENIIINDKTSKAYNINYRSIFEACPFRDKLLDYQSLIPKLPQYQSWTEKESQYSLSNYIKTEEELDKALIKLESVEEGLLFRGIYDAGFKMFASSQRHWFQISDRILPLGSTDYYNSINNLLSIVKSCPAVQTYQQKQDYSENDMYLLALMQHFGMPSPMIDFSYSMRKALFFAVDGMPKWVDRGTDNPDDYVSLYYVNKRVDWIASSAQMVMACSGPVIENLVNELRSNEPGIHLETKDTLNDIKHLAFSQFVPTGEYHDIRFIPVNGAEIGVAMVDIPSLNFSCGYMISNDRILAQDGMFILNNTIDQPLVEVINRQTKDKFFCCLNIHKSLVPYIWERHLLPYDLTHEKMYCEKDEDVMTLQQALDRL